MKIKAIFLFLLTALWSAQSGAYLTERYASGPTNCVRSTSASPIAAYTETNFPYTLDTSLLRTLGNGQYLMLVNPVAERYFNGFGGASSFVKTCSNLGEPQSQITVRYEPEEGSQLITIKENSVVNLLNLGSTGIDEDSNGLLAPSSIPGLFFMLTERMNMMYPPVRVVHKDDLKEAAIWGGPMLPVVNNQFRGFPKGTVVASTPIYKILVTDENEQGATHGTEFIQYKWYSSAMDIQLTASCMYTLSDNGVVDFGSVAAGDVTGSTVDRNSARQVKQMTLNMDDCYGVDKVKTTVTATNNTPVLENGLVLGNNVGTGPQHVGVAIRVNPQYRNKDGSNDNAGKDLYFNSSNPLTWTFGNTYTTNAMSKNITLDVYLLPSGGAVTPGDYHGTATIMMDFV
ncbi:fimbrial protein [Trabulsiella odontotermitis]|uniref:fimbrial protein n=1 Tax=Trabulsiella odontotermitis TaxID=379893 RepID=UPI00138EDD6A|nr:fimbrial protein [Trabulsiella odontotermitis]